MSDLTPKEQVAVPQSPIVDVEYEYAGFWVRMLASVIDAVLFMLFYVPVVLVLITVGVLDPMHFDSYNTGYTWFDVVSNLVFFALYVGLWVKFAGTPGKRLLGLKILDDKTGNHLTIGQAVIRYLGYIPAIFVFCIGLIWVAFDKKKQGWHDKMAKSVVVKELR